MLFRSKAVGAQGAGVSSIAAAATGTVSATALVGGALKIAVGNATAVDVGAALTVTAAQTTAGQAVGSAYNVARTINAAGIGGLQAEANTSVTAAWTTTTGADTYTINGVAIAVGSGATFTDFVTTINQNVGATGVQATYANGKMTLTAADGRDISLAKTTGGTGGLGTATGATENNVANSVQTFDVAGTYVSVGTVRLSSNDRITISGTAPGNAGFAAGTLALGNTSLSSASVTTVTNANSAINAVDASLSTISNLRSTFGAIQNRFDSVIANLSSSVENLSASRSRIQDADFAVETANLSRSQILQQAGTAMVAQANQLPQGVLALLR